MASAASVYTKQIERPSLSDLMPHLAYDKDTCLYALSDGYVGFGFVSPPLSGTDDTVAQRLNVFLTFEYPEGSFIQVMLLASQDIRERMAAMAGMRDAGSSKSLRKSSENRVSLFVGATERPISHNLPALVRDFRVVISIKIPQGSAEGLPSVQDMDSANGLRLKTGESLKSAGLGVSNLDPETLLRTIGTLLHWGPNAGWRQAEPVYDGGKPINEQIAESDDMLEVDGTGVWLGRKRLRILSPGRLPPTMELWNMRRMVGDAMTGMRGMHGNFFINLNLFIPDNSSERSSLETKRTSINYQAFGPMPHFVPKIMLKKESSDILNEAVMDGDRIVKMMLCVGVFADSPGESQSRVSEAVTYFREIGWDVKEDTYIHFPMLVNCIPLAADARAVPFLKRYNTVGSSHAVEFMPIVGDWPGTGTPMLNFVSRSGALMAVDIFDSSTNYNTTIVAASGSGKSFLTNDIITSYISAGAVIWTIDIGRSYEKLCKDIGGDFVEFGEASNICLNPFEIVKNYGEEADMLVGIVVSMASMADKLSDLQYARLRAIIKVLWDRHGAGLMVDHIAAAATGDEDRRVNDLGHQLYAFTTKGEYGKYFNGKNTITFTKDLTVLELEELKGRTHLQAVVLLILIHQIQNAMYMGDRSRRKILIIDEAWDLLAKGDIAKFIETGYRRFRKYNGAAITVTQSLNDLYSSPSGIAIAENSANFYLLYQKQETIESIKRQNRLVIGESGYAYLKSVHTVTGAYSEIFFITGYGSGVGRLVVDKYTKLLYSTHPDDIRKIMRRTESGMTVAEAIDDILTSE